MDHLISRDSKGKIRVVEMSYNWDEEQHGFVIHRTTGMLGGKMTEQPNIVIFRGKASRTIQDQVLLEYNSNKKKYLDKGYKLLENELESYTEDQLNEIIGDIVTDSSGFAKHMLAKQADKIKDSSIEKVDTWAISVKIDGVRCSFYWKDGEVKSASRGGGDYDPSTYQLREHPILCSLLSTHPDWILDGELYKHGKSLQQISGAARLEKTASGCNWLEYYIYDIMIPDKTFEERYEILNEIAHYINQEEFNPEREWEKDELRVHVVPHYFISGDNKKEQIIKLHDLFVSNGWEGCVARDISKCYKFGGRGNEMIKFKSYKDDCFKVIGIEEGLRGSEDMVFILETEDGKPFKAKPFGDRNQKQEYWDNFEEKYKGQIGECKFFYYSDDGVPLQPSFKAFRYDLD